jgi:hypothetical protein
MQESDLLLQWLLPMFLLAVMSAELDVADQDYRWSRTKVNHKFAAGFSCP